MIIVWPDFEGRGALGAFGQEMVGEFGEAAICIPVVNGLPYDEQTRIVQAIRSKYPSFRPTASNDKGIVAALTAGYENAIVIAPDDCVVRLDTDEHPIDQISVLAAEAVSSSGVAIGDLTFTDKTLVAGSLDEMAHLDIWPIMSRMATGLIRDDEGVVVSCAFGFNAYGEGVLKQLLPLAKTIVRKASLIASEPVTWGFDMAMLVAASILGLPVTKIPITAQKARNRSRGKITHQFTGNLAMLFAGIEINTRGAIE